MKRIGFANKYYTLWDVSEETMYRTVNDVHFASGTKTTFTYYQNLSTDLEKAISKAKSMGVTILEVDEDLRGKTRSFSSVKNRDDIYNDNQFKFGRYEALQISDCEDVDYLIWYFGETDSKVVAEQIVRLDDSYSFDGKSLLSRKDQLIKEAEYAINNGEVILTAVSNFQYSEERDYASIRVIFDTETEALETLENSGYCEWGFIVHVENVSDNFTLCKKSFRGHDYYVPKGMRSFKKTEFRLVNGKIKLI
jgi:hypothetical protein